VQGSIAELGACAVNRLHKGTRNRVRTFRNGTREKKAIFSNEKISSFDVTSVRLVKGPPARNKQGTEAENVGPVRKELFSEMCNAARSWSWRHTVKLFNLKTSPVALACSSSDKPVIKFWKDIWKS
jgi:hypothetical protein